MTTGEETRGPRRRRRLASGSKSRLATLVATAGGRPCQRPGVGARAARSSVGARRSSARDSRHLRCGAADRERRRGGDGRRDERHIVGIARRRTAATRDAATIGRGAADVGRRSTRSSVAVPTRRSARHQVRLVARATKSSTGCRSSADCEAADRGPATAGVNEKSYPQLRQRSTLLESEIAALGTFHGTGRSARVSGGAGRGHRRQREKLPLDSPRRRSASACCGSVGRTRRAPSARRAGVRSPPARARAPAPSRRAAAAAARFADDSS